MAELSEQLDVAERALTRNIAWVAAADAKVPPIFAIDAAMLAVMAAMLPPSSAWYVPTAIAAAITVVLLLVSIGCLALASFPRLSGPKDSIIFFGTAINRDEKSYVDRLREGISEALVLDVSRQAYRNAEIAAEKYRVMKWAQVTMFCAAIPWLVAITLLYNEQFRWLAPGR
jgi:pycsar effector protein